MQIFFNLIVDYFVEYFLSVFRFFNKGSKVFKQNCLDAEIEVSINYQQLKIQFEKIV